MDKDFLTDKIKKSVKMIKKSSYTVVFTGAGISVASGIPTFRGENGFWEKYDPSLLSINFFKNNPQKSWQVLTVIYDKIKQAEPNKAHKILAYMQKEDYIQQIITQNIDNLHQDAGCNKVYELHGNYLNLLCLECNKKYDLDKKKEEHFPCCNKCGSVLKPDVVFFGEGLSSTVYDNSIKEAEKADLFLIIGTSGEVAPANSIPWRAKNRGANIIEISPEPSKYTRNIVDLFLQITASEGLEQIYSLL